MSKHAPPPRRLLDTAIIRRAVFDAVRKLDPRMLVASPVMLIVEAGAILTSGYAIADAARGGPSLAFDLQIALWLWFTVLFATFAEAVAEGRGRAQADALRRTRRETMATRRRADGGTEQVGAAQLRRGDIVIVAAGELIPGDGDVEDGAAMVDESAVTGESAPVVRESGGDRSAVTGGTRVLSDRLVIRITSNPGETFLDRMIALVEGARRQKTPNEIALTILLSGMTIIFILALIALQAFAHYSGAPASVVVLIALLVCLIPTTIGGLLPAIGIAGIDRVYQRNVMAMSGRAVEAAGDVGTMLLDKTGTITFGNRLAVDVIPAPGVGADDVRRAALLASWSDTTPEGRSIIALVAGENATEPAELRGATFVPFSAVTRMSGVDIGPRAIRKGAVDAVLRLVPGGGAPGDVRARVEAIANAGGTPLAVADGPRLLGIIHLKDVLKPGMGARFERLRAMGIKTVMITGDNPLTAAAIAREAGVDTFIAEATPETKMAYIRREQAGGRLVAMSGDGTNDAPALAQADVGVAMQTGTMAAKEAANMVDLDSDPTKLIDVVEIGKQLLMTRGALTTFSIANDVAKYFAIIPAMFTAAFPQLAALNVMGLHSPHSAILSSVIFNALIIVALIPLSLRGVRYRPLGAAALLRRNLFVYGVGGLVAPFAGIKLIDLLVTWFGA